MATRNMFASTQKPMTASSINGNASISNKKKNQTPNDDANNDDVFESLSRIAATHAATRIRDATLRLLMIWYENISQKMLGALDVPAQHLEAFQKEPNEDALTNFMDSFVAAQEVIKEQLAAPSSSDDENENDGNLSPNSRRMMKSKQTIVGPRGNPFEINNRLFDLFVQAIDDAIGSVKVAIQEDDEGDKEGDENNTAANKNSEEKRSIAADERAAPMNPSVDKYGIGMPTMAPQQQQPTPSREWKQLPHDDTPSQYGNDMNNNNIESNYNANGNYQYQQAHQQQQQQSNMAPSANRLHHHNYNNNSGAVTPSNASVADTETSGYYKDTGVSSYLTQLRQKKYGVAGKVGIGGRGGDGMDESVALPIPHSQARSQSSQPPQQQQQQRSGIHSAASGNNNIFGTNNPNNAQQQQQHGPPPHFTPRAGGRAHPQHMNLINVNTGSFLHYNNNDDSNDNVSNNNNNGGRIPVGGRGGNGVGAGGINQMSLPLGGVAAAMRPSSASSTSAINTPRRNPATNNNSSQIMQHLSHGNNNNNGACPPFGVDTSSTSAFSPQNRPQSRASSAAGRGGAGFNGNGAVESAKQSQLRHEIQLLEAQITAARNAHGSESDTAKTKIFAINKKISVLKAELLKESREVEEVMRIQRERDAQRMALDEKRRIFHR